MGILRLKDWYRILVDAVPVWGSVAGRFKASVFCVVGVGVTAGECLI